jgi:ABC-type branched-subunit amino acid transport system substrate-binding protein
VHSWFAIRKSARRRRHLCHSLFLMALFGLAQPAHAQSIPTDGKPYAKLDRGSVTYRGPANAIEKEISDGVAAIGMILPLSGAAQSQGKALLTAAQIALEEEQERGPLADGRKLTLVARDESGPWGQASSEILKLVEQDHVLAVLTSANGNTAHLADQLANKISFPILTLASDPTTTEANVPWLFRLGPSDTDQARVFCRRIYEESKLRNVLLIVQGNHDGRIGGAEFEKAVRNLNAPAPERLEIGSSAPNLEAIRAAIRAHNPDGIVLWTDARLASELLPMIRKATAASASIFLCQKAAQLEREEAELGGLFTVGSGRVQQKAVSNFERSYRARAGASPGSDAVEVYEAVHLVVDGLRRVGANRILLREFFATLGKTAGAAEVISFDPAGNSTQTFAVVGLTAEPVAVIYP